MGGTDSSRRSEQHDDPDVESDVELTGDPAPAQGRIPKKRRRVMTTPPEGSDPHPTSEPERHLAHENDERLKGDKPPHWG